MLIDEATIQVESGKGGSGSASFHREKHVPRGGPNGADGGRGGDIVLVADRGKRTLLDFQYKKKFQAPSGSDAVGNKSGRDGTPVEIHVPVGTEVWDDEFGEKLADLVAHGQRLIVCRGGRGGRGNLHYTSSVRQAPKFAEKGAPNESASLRLVLKLLADVGLVGLPNAGKSTLISRISAAKPKIADYPFTTIEPNLGVVQGDDYTFTVADMPGLIEGASEGRGLGHQFLKHVERTRVLVHVVECLPLDESDPMDNFNLVEAELKAYSPELHARPRLIALSKADLVAPEEGARLAELFRTCGAPVFVISGVTGYGLSELVRAMQQTLIEHEEPAAVEVVSPVLVRPDDDQWEAHAEGEGYVVSGKRVERIVAMTDHKSDEALHYLHRRLLRLGVIDRLRELGAEEGDSVRIGERVFAFTDQ